MMKFVILTVLIACVAAAPAPGNLVVPVAPVLSSPVAVAHAVPLATSYSHSASYRAPVVKSVIATPVIAAPIVKATPLVHVPVVKTLHAAPIVHAAPLVHATPIIKASPIAVAHAPVIAHAPVYASGFSAYKAPLTIVH